MGYMIVMLGAYLLGCSNMAMYLAKLKNVDLSGGSGNPGTSNATLLMGWGPVFWWASMISAKACWRCCWQN